MKEPKMRRFCMNCGHKIGVRHPNEGLIHIDSGLYVCVNETKKVAE